MHAHSPSCCTFILHALQKLKNELREEMRMTVMEVAGRGGASGEPMVISNNLSAARPAAAAPVVVQLPPPRAQVQDDSCCCTVQ